jgi:hypothetical protein
MTSFFSIKSLLFPAGLLACVCTLLSGSADAGPLGVIDNFSGTLSGYTATRILKATPAASDNVGQWEIDSSAVRYNTTSYFGIEQYALTRNDFTLQLGEELRVDYLGTNLDSQDIGLYVGAGTPTSGVRANYVNIYARNNGQVFTRGFDGTTELSLAGGATPTGLEALYITRLTTDTFELGYYTTGGNRNLLSTRTISAGNAAGIGGAVGLYADVRGLGIRGSVDNLRIVSAPVAGDVNGDGIVNGADFGFIRDNLFVTPATRTQGDLTGDNIVDFADYRQWKDNAGALASLYSLNSVPEPTALVLSVLAVGVAASRRRV